MAAVGCVLIGASLAIARQEQPDLSGLPAVIKSGEWKSIDTTALTPVQRCRVLFLMDSSLDEIVAKNRAQADLLSQYIDESDLGKQCAAFVPPADPRPLTFDDAKKIATAMLEGPLAQSSYATMFADVNDPQVLSADEWLYESSSQRKWAEAVETRRQLIWMVGFLQSKDLVEAFRAWAPGAIAQHEKETAAAAERRQAEVEALVKAQDEAFRKRQQQLAQAQQQQMQVQLATSMQLQQAFNAGQQPLQVAPQVVQPMTVYPYNGAAYGYGLANLATAAYYRDDAYRGVAAASCARRMGGWRGGFRR